MTAETTRTLFIQATYLAASVFFILGLKSLTRVDDARRGMNQAALGMLLAVVGTLVNHEIVRYEWILVGLAVGSLIGYPLGMFVPMTAMPQRIAISHMFGALAATLVGVAEYYTAMRHGGVSSPKMAALGFEVLFGALTVTGSFVAFGKLQEIITGRPVTYRGQNVINVALFVAMVGLLVYLVVRPETALLFYVMIALALLFGLLLVLPIGGADMPVVISLMNSYAGLAASATGFAIGNNVLIIAGALDGASGFILSMVMSKAMNRSFANVLFGAFGSAAGAGPAKTAAGLTARSISLEDAAILLAYARNVIVVPGYGMAVAQAQHQIRELAELIEKNGGDVHYAIHPVAGRMPGHLNVILADARVEYDRLITDIQDANTQLHQADIALVIGANDVVNPAALDDKASPIYGMPVIQPQLAKTVIVMKRGQGTGFSGIENALFYLPNTVMLYGDAKKSLASLVSEIKASSDSGGHR